jgi:3-keto-disaccharide hydrolase
MTSRTVGTIALGIAATLLHLVASVAASAQTITFENDALGKPPKDFEFGLAGEGGPGRWQIVADKTAGGGRALAQLSTARAANRFLVAIYNPTVFANGEITTRCKPVSGRVDRACGLIVRAADARNYYIARANALEDNVRFYRVRNGQRQELATADNVKVASGQWQTLTLRAEGNRYTVIFNGKELHTTTDTTSAESRPTEGRSGLWVKSDSVTHFERIEITKLP